LGVCACARTDSVHMLLDAYHSNFKELQTIQRVEYGTIWAGGGVSSADPPVNGRNETATFSNVPFVVIENYNNDRHAKVDSFGLNTDFSPNEQWKFNADVTYSQAKAADLRR